MPALYAHSEPKKVRIDFQVIFEQPAPPPQTQYQPPVNNHFPPQSARAPHDGMRDVGTAAGGNRVLLLRQLDSGTHGDAIIRRIAEEISKILMKPGEEKLGEMAINRVVMIVDKNQGGGWGMCFVELVTAEVCQFSLSRCFFALGRVLMECSLREH